jgi:hypothetical protein
LAPLEVGHEVGIVAKSRLLRLPCLQNVAVLPTLGRTFRLVQQKNLASEEKRTGTDFGTVIFDEITGLSLNVI